MKKIQFYENYDVRGCVDKTFRKVAYLFCNQFAMM